MPFGVKRWKTSKNSKERKGEGTLTSRGEKTRNEKRIDDQGRGRRKEGKFSKFGEHGKHLIENIGRRDDDSGRGEGDEVGDHGE